MSSEKTKKPLFRGHVKKLVSREKAEKLTPNKDAKKPVPSDYLKKLVREAKFHARGLQIPEGAAESFIEFAIKDIPKKVLKSDDEDLIRRTFIENLAKYNRDYAYVLKNYRAML